MRCGTGCAILRDGRRTAAAWHRVSATRRSASVAIAMRTIMRRCRRRERRIRTTRPATRRDWPAAAARTIRPPHVPPRAQRSHRPAARPGGRVLRDALVLPVRGPRRPDAAEHRVRHLRRRAGHRLPRRLPRPASGTSRARSGASSTRSSTRSSCSAASSSSPGKNFIIPDDRRRRAGRRSSRRSPASCRRWSSSSSARELLVTSLRGMSESGGQSFGAAFSGKLKMVFQSVTILVILVYVNYRRWLLDGTGTRTSWSRRVVSRRLHLERRCVDHGRSAALLVRASGPSALYRADKRSPPAAGEGAACTS